MITVTFKPSLKTVRVEQNSTLLDAARLADISVGLPCGGKGVCGKCLVKVLSGDINPNNNGTLPSVYVEQGYVLLCRALLLDTDVVIQTFSEKEMGKFSDSFEDYLRLDEKLRPKKNSCSFLVEKQSLIVSAPKLGDGLSDLDRLKNSINGIVPCDNIAVPVSVLQKLPSALRESSGEVEIYYCLESNILTVLDIFPVDKKPKTFTLAIDIGTTTVAVCLIDDLGEAIDMETAYNSQVECGLDIISRINYARTPDRLFELKQKVLSTINKIIDSLVKKNGLERRDSIMSASIAGNTTMIHLLLGVNPEYIRLDPYTPAVFSLKPIPNTEVGLKINQNAVIDFAPAVGSYVGGDITAGILCTSLSTDEEELSLFIDIGTNGEIVLGNADFLMACACSAGPAFEGGGIECGMRASEGAIERVKIIDGEFTVSVIGNTVPTGICGSGMISLIAEMFKSGIIDAAGKIDRSAKGVKTKGRTAFIKIADGKKGDITVSEIDIENIIRTKAAIYSAVKTMLNNIGMSFDDIAKVYIAGGFGRYLDLDDARTIGLLPYVPLENYIFLGNSSLSGTRMCAVSAKHRELRDNLAKKITYLDLGLEAGYMEEYTAAMFLPHTDKKLFE